MIEFNYPDLGASCGPSSPKIDYPPIRLEILTVPTPPNIGNILRNMGDFDLSLLVSSPNLLAICVTRFGIGYDVFDKACNQEKKDMALYKKEYEKYSLDKYNLEMSVWKQKCAIDMENYKRDLADYNNRPEIKLLNSSVKLATSSMDVLSSVNLLTSSSVNSISECVELVPGVVSTAVNLGQSVSTSLGKLDFGMILLIGAIILFIYFSNRK